MKKRTFVIEVTMSAAGAKELEAEQFADLPDKATDADKIKALLELYIEHFAPSPIKVTSVKEKT